MDLQTASGEPWSVVTHPWPSARAASSSSRRQKEGGGQRLDQKGRALHSLVVPSIVNAHDGDVAGPSLEPLYPLLRHMSLFGTGLQQSPVVCRLIGGGFFHLPPLFSFWPVLGLPGMPGLAPHHSGFIEF